MRERRGRAGVAGGRVTAGGGGGGGRGGRECWRDCWGGGGGCVTAVRVQPLSPNPEIPKPP